MPIAAHSRPAALMSLLFAVALAAILAASLASCGGGGGSDAQPDPVPAQPEASPTEDVEADAADEPDLSPAGDAEDDQAEPSGPRQTGEVDGIVFDVGGDSEATFTVEEQLARLPLPIDAVMSTGAVSGAVRLDGGPSSVEIELTQLSSDQEFRDNYVQRRMFGSHPVATFSVDDVGELPSGFADGDTVTTSVAGTLSLVGSEFPVTFDIEARDDGHTVFVLGSTEFTWEQFGIPVPTARSVVWVADEVRVQVLLELVPRDGG